MKQSLSHYGQVSAENNFILYGFPEDLVLLFLGSGIFYFRFVKLYERFPVKFKVLCSFYCQNSVRFIFGFQLLFVTGFGCWSLCLDVILFVDCIHVVDRTPVLRYLPVPVLAHVVGREFIVWTAD